MTSPVGFHLDKYREGGRCMREIDMVGAELANALGFSAQYTQTQVKLLCRGGESDSGQATLIVELRISPRKVLPRGAQEKDRPNAGKGTKSPGNPMTPHKSLLQSVID
jgi:hypothetical protein